MTASMSPVGFICGIYTDVENILDSGAHTAKQTHDKWSRYVEWNIIGGMGVILPFFAPLP